MGAPFEEPRRIGRYTIGDPIASGGMATVHLGRISGAAGFQRVVAIKRLRRHLAADPEVGAMLVDEARIAARIRHPNVVPTLDVIAEDRELCVVMEYVEGESFVRLLTATLRATGRPPDARFSAAVVAGMLRGLHAAHEAKSETGEPLGVVHRDVSPQNVMVGADGVPRVLDFGIAKAVGRLQTTLTGQIKGKLAYMAPEQLRSKHPVTRRTDIYGASVVLWEALTGRRLFSGHDDEIVRAILEGGAPPPSSIEPSVPRELDEVVLRGLAREPDGRHASAKEMAEAIERCVAPASTAELAAWVEQMAATSLGERARRVAELEGRAAIELDPTDGAETRKDARAPAPATPEPAQVPASVPLPAPALVEVPVAAAAHAHAAAEVPAAVPREEAPAPGPAAAPRGARGERRRLVIVACVASAATAAVLVLARPTPAPLAAPSPEPSASANVSAPEPVPTPPPSSLEAPPEPADSGDPTHPAPPASSAPEVPDAGTSRPSAAAPPHPREPRTSQSTRCNPPFWFDRDGVKHFKQECVH